MLRFFMDPHSCESEALQSIRRKRRHLQAGDHQSSHYEMSQAEDGQRTVDNGNVGRRSIAMTQRRTAIGRLSHARPEPNTSIYGTRKHTTACSPVD